MNDTLDSTRRDPVIDMNGAIQRRLAHFNRRRMRPGTADTQWREALHRDHQMSLLEAQFIEAERRAMQPLMNAVPTDPDAFMHWFEALREHGPGQFDPLFDWLAERATLADMRWFLEQEVAGEAGFDDLVALTQVGMPTRPKLEMARNYWDELGRGSERRMHGPMLQRTAADLKLAPQIENVVWEALALANLMQGLASNRRYAYHSVGALGAVELTAPTRVSKVDAGLERLGQSRETRCYFILHAHIDIKHSRDWNAEIIRPLIEDNPDALYAIAEGALLRLNAGARCFDRYARVLMPDDSLDADQYPSEASRASSPSISRMPMSFR